MKANHSPFTTGNTIIQCNYEPRRADFYRIQCDDKEEQRIDVEGFFDVVAVWTIKPKPHAQPSRLAVNSNGNLQNTNTIL